jgi:hypothetical protein
MDLSETQLQSMNTPKHFDVWDLGHAGESPVCFRSDMEPRFAVLLFRDNEDALSLSYLARSGMGTNKLKC